MINILPTEIKQQIKYSRRNVVLVRYCLLVGAVSMALIITLGISYWYGNHQLQQLNQVLASRQSQRAAYKDTEAKIAALQTSLNLIEKLFNEKTTYSKLLADLAAVLPRGASINSVSLTGDEQKPLDLIVAVDSFTKAGQVRSSLLSSARIKSADIQSVTKSEDSNLYIVDIVAAFQPGQAR